ncbi:hypothetical protein [Microbacterium sp. PMB16]|uniref:hypothetical protein n=1 Tax=Microbacterium sp. PMB16 TaxID=3120157 RepID=UPI003F4C578D
MDAIMVGVYSLSIVAAVAVLWIAVNRRRGAAPSARLAPVIRAARRRALIAVLFSATVFLAGTLAGIALPGLLGQPFAVAPFIAGAAGLALYGATPPRAVTVREDEPRDAVLVPRSPLSVVPARWATVLVVVTALFVLLVAFCGVTASPDDVGHSRTIRFEAADTASWSSPYPGWFYGVPALLGLLCLSACTLIALRRISSTAAFPQVADAELDQHWRRRSVEVVVKLAVGAVLFSFGGIAVIAGLSMGNAIIDGSTPIVWGVIAVALRIAGIAALVLSVGSVTLAGLTAATIGRATPSGAVPSEVAVR